MRAEAQVSPLQNCPNAFAGSNSAILGAFVRAYRQSEKVAMDVRTPGRDK